jgi:hypothetical protein
MTRTRHGAFRAASVVSNATARDKLKRRDKQYKTEHLKVLAKKRRLSMKVGFGQGQLQSSRSADNIPDNISS